MLVTLASRDLDLCARTVKFLASGGADDLRAALACTLRNRLLAAWRAAMPSAMDVCQDFCREATGTACAQLFLATGASCDVEWYRALAINCLAWSGDLVDPTNGATSCHRHDMNARWAARRAATALIGAYIFLR
jgi:hypothetical protein